MLIFKKFIFISVPKTASSSINVILSHKQFPEPELHHASISKVSEEIDISKFFSFAFVRNPWDRLLSAYCDFKQVRKRQYSSKIMYKKPLLHEFKNFHDFCLEFPNTKWANDVHFRPQHTFLEIDGKIAVDFVGRYENLIEDAGKVFKKMGLPNAAQKLKRIRIRKTEHLDYHNLYNDKTRKVIGDFFQKDIEIFGYDKF